MPILPYLPLISSGLDVLGGLFNMNQTKKANDANIANQWKMFNATNEYNTPLNQRKRMEAAGFNPNIMYGSGSVANVATQSKIPERTAPQTDVGGLMSRFLDTALKTINTNNLERQIKAELDLKASQTDKNYQDIRTNMEREKQINQATRFSATLFPSSLKAQELKVDSLNQDIIKKVQDNQFLPTRQKQMLQESLTRIAQAKTNMSYTDVKRMVEQELLSLNRKGFSWSDPIYVRYFKDMVPTASDAIDNLIKLFKK